MIYINRKKMDMKLRQSAGILFVILVVMMTIYLIIMPTTYETFVDAGRCGVGLPPCSGEHIRCINGYCKSDIPSKLPALSDLEMTPSTKYPYA
jgi:hypothetical protein